MCSATDHQVCHSSLSLSEVSTERQSQIKYSVSLASAWYLSVSQWDELKLIALSYFPPQAPFIRVHEIKQQSREASLQKKNSAPWSAHKGWYE